MISVQTPVFARYIRAGRAKESWLNDALDKIHTTKFQLGINDGDFDRPDGEWNPIEIDRNLPEYDSVITAVDEAVEKIRTDNGYVASQPEEQQYVSDGLKTFASRFRGAKSISIPYIRQYAIEPISRALKRLGNSATGVVVEVAKARLREWLMKQGVPWPWD